MIILTDLKTCKKGLHQYDAKRKRCPECVNQWTREWRKKNPERANKWRKENSSYYSEYRRKNSSRIVERVSKWRKENPEKAKQTQQKWRSQNIEKSNKSSRDWKKKNKDKTCAAVARRNALKNKAMPPWADLVAIKEFYTLSNQLTKETGIQHEVDHIYPLKSKYMCGLHVESNLQILTKEENRKKGNRRWPGQLDCQK